MILCFEVPSSVLLFRFGIQNKEVVCMFACSFFFCVLALKKKKVVGSRLLCLYLSILYFVFKSLSYLPLFTNRFLFLPAAANAGHLSVCGRTLKWDKRRLVSCFLPSCLPESQLPAQCDLLRNEIVLEKELVFFFLSSCFFFFFRFVFSTFGHVHFLLKWKNSEYATDWTRTQAATDEVSINVAHITGWWEFLFFFFQCWNVSQYYYLYRCVVVFPISALMLCFFFFSFLITWCLFFFLSLSLYYAPPLFRSSFFFFSLVFFLSIGVHSDASRLCLAC